MGFWVCRDDGARTAAVPGRAAACWGGRRRWAAGGPSHALLALPLPLVLCWLLVMTLPTRSSLMSGSRLAARRSAWDRAAGRAGRV